MPYTTPQDVRDYTGVRPEWFGHPDVGALDKVLARWIHTAEERVDEFLGRSYDDASVPEVVKEAVEVIVQNRIIAGRLTRNAGMVTIDEATGAQTRGGKPSQTFFTDAIKDDIRHLQRKGGSVRSVARGSIGAVGPSSELNHRPVGHLIGDPTLYQYKAAHLPLRPEQRGN